MFIWMPPATEAPDARPAPHREPENPPSAPDFLVLPDSVPLRAIRDFAGQLLQWVQPTLTTSNERWAREDTFELRCGEVVLARMRYETTLWGFRRGRAETTEGTWLFRGQYKDELAIEATEGAPI